ncbi:exodeoxyribonuclease III [Candidatus Curculioniphilus buchneri]|uniref:exodeoxyribonuclease III n=1 Tax=Candidatus Curculioniphilus buchneri TaxID=690594 RepID=UPI00376F1AD3
MKIVSFNINGLRAHLHQIEAIIIKLQPDIIGLQETKVHDDMFPVEKMSHYGYYLYYYGHKGYAGVALLSRKKPLSVHRGFSTDGENETQRRIIIADFDTSYGLLTIINGYSPQGEGRNHPIKFPAKKKFFHNLQDHIEQHHNSNSLLLIIGDMNISPTDLDIGIGEKNRKRWLQIGKCSFLPEERKWIDQLLAWGLIDIYRQKNPTVSNHYSWFDYRSHSFNENCGLRIDLLLASQRMFSFIRSTGISYEIRAMIKPSDHAPIWADFDL